METETKVEQTHPEQIVIPQKLHAPMRLDHFGVVLNNLAIFMMVVCIVGLIGKVVLWLAGAMIVILGFVLLIAITLFSLGLALISPGIQQAWHDLPQIMDNVATISAYFDAFYSILPYFCAGMLALALGSFFIFQFNKKFRHPARKVMGIIVSVLAIVVMIFIIAAMIAGGVAWIN